MADNNSLTFSGLDSEVFVCLSDADSLKTEEGWRDCSGKCIQVGTQEIVLEWTTRPDYGELKWAG